MVSLSVFNIIRVWLAIIINNFLLACPLFWPKLLICPPFYFNYLLLLQSIYTMYLTAKLQPTSAVLSLPHGKVQLGWLNLGSKFIPGSAHILDARRTLTPGTRIRPSPPHQQKNQWGPIGPPHFFLTNSSRHPSCTSKDWTRDLIIQRLQPY